MAINKAIIVKNTINKNILQSMRDQAAADALRRILYEDSVIDWDKAYEHILEAMPELILGVEIK